ncbi:MAG: SsrA-binding protein SmpB [Lactobacillus sp.]|jgi:SsrA-binding protein|uniref:SsrA-binding protein n=1 Tax=Lacticaseibacillus suilingensis TaxID=2799577 RepID=A0ABW4BIK4_9LACO|nr:MULTISPECIES: SsrA-binding protein SmpB [Lacticaseibacillus]MCI1894104.1 SsrA-binding protein SmpB [Lactobacillus sp.]MCI1941420.1 SsrA-binding protein SmpB [Lactobacillus sp.]MCI1972069.1 SsrA-binding protein SmpB [Lactobacillus sp.]MCI2016088.1 SsrA-binding protein SmpB [Lactobacillus sp.]MCI2036479.1 SsrA-binding protein SmpB [Lactobacillus sp.]
MAKKMKPKADNVLAQNKKARHDYNILDTYEAGIALTGTEIKSVRDGKTNLRDGFVRITNDEAWLVNVHISPYKEGNQFNVDPLRNRKLLLHKKEIRKLLEALTQQGLTAVPLKMYLKHGYAKVLVGVAQGKKLYDKRESLKQKDQKRDIARAMKERY